MSLRASQLRIPENQSLSVSDRVERCCDIAKEFENRGEFDQACKVLSDYWPRIGELPKLKGLESSTAAELLLRAGVLTGIIGGHRQIPDGTGTHHRGRACHTFGSACSGKGRQLFLLIGSFDHLRESVGAT